MVQVNPIRKVVGMLQDMSHELEREADQEKELFEKALCMCKAADEDLTNVIQDSTSQITRLTSKISEETAQNSALKQELKEHYSNKADVEQDLDKATKLRTKETEKFQESEKMNSFAVNSLNKAIPALERGESSASLMQGEDAPDLRRLIEVTRYLSTNNRESVLAFMDDGLGGSSEAPPSSGEVVGILKGMRDHMAADLKDMRHEEQVAAVGYKDLKAAKDEELGVANSAIATKEKRSGELDVSISDSKDSLEDYQSELANAQKYLKVVNDQCGKKEQERDTRAKMRADEIAAIGEAINILNEDDALDTFKKALPSASLVAAKSKTYDAALMQYHTNGRLESKIAKDLTVVRNIVVGLEKKHPSSRMGLLLSTVSSQVRTALRAPDEGAAGGAKNIITGMINDMVNVLHDEDQEDEHKKEFCANETARSASLKQEKQEAVDSLQSSIEEMTDELSNLKEEIKTLEATIRETDLEVMTASEQRKKEHQEFVDSFATSETARRLIDKAANRLAKFYSPKAHAEKEGAKKAMLLKITPTLPPNAAARRMAAAFDSFAQKKVESGRHQSKMTHHVAPPKIIETPEGPVQKKESGGIVGILMTLKSDITADMTEAETEEKFSAKDYVRVMKEAQETRAQDTKSLTQKRNAKAEIDEQLTESKEARATTMKELENIQLYTVQLHTECDFLVRNFEARHEGRVQEEVGLASAESALTGEGDAPSAEQVEAAYAGEDGAAPAQPAAPAEEEQAE